MDKEKFETKMIKVDGDCWPWLEHVDKDGYGKVRVGKEKLRAHRVSYELYVGPIPAGLVIDHLCLNKPCVNPDHLEVVTIAENNKRRPYTNLCEHGSGETRCEQGCGARYRQLYSKQYYKKRKKLEQEKAKDSYSNGSLQHKQEATRGNSTENL